MKKRISILAILLALLTVLSACGEKTEKGTESEGTQVAVHNGTGENSESSGKTPESTGDPTKIPSTEENSKTDYHSAPEYYAENKDGVIEGTGHAMNGDYDAEIAVDEVYDVPAEAPTLDCEERPLEGAVPEIGEPTEEYFDPSIQATAGTLTAGEIRDNRDFTPWKALLDGDWKDLGDTWMINTANRVMVNVCTNDGYTVMGATIRLIDKNGGEIYSAVTNALGVAYLFYGVESTAQAITPETVTLSYKGVEESKPFSGDECSFTLDTVEPNAKKLDLMFVVDTTGSMSDEIDFLKAEVEELINRAANTGYAVRTSVNFYRDETDEYVVKYYGFETDPAKVKATVAQQYATGGGDYEEAVHSALSNAVYDHAWEKDSVKIMFLILDAPPHQTDEIVKEISGTVTDAAAMGIRIIPVASSGVDKNTEFMLRSYALLTGGSYAFLTDTSGVGNPHLEPSADQYEEELLIDLMTRLICEYCGVNYTPPKTNVDVKPEPENPDIIIESDDPFDLSGDEMPIELKPEIGFDIDPETENPNTQPENPDIVTESGDPIDLNGEGMIDLSGDESIETVISCTSEWKFPYLRDIIAGTAEIGAVKNEGFVNVDEHPIGSEDEAIDRAKNEATVHYDIVLVAYDDVDCVWVVHFSLRDTLGGDQLVYLGKDGKTVLVVYGE